MCFVFTEYPIVQLEEEDFVCTGIEAYLSTIASLSALVIVVVALTITCYKYEFEIKIHLFEKFNWHPFDKQDREIGKEYDVYLMYCKDDEGYAINTLLVGLEQFGYKVFIGVRDFTIGASTAAEMAEAFSKSHRVLVVVSQKFLNNKYAMSDFYHAYEHDRSATRRRFLVLVKLRERLNIEQHDIFKKYLSTDYFLPARVKSFWHKLRYWLPPIEKKQLPASTDNIEEESESFEESEAIDDSEGTHLISVIPQII